MGQRGTLGKSGRILVIVVPFSSVIVVVSLTFHTSALVCQNFRVSCWSSKPFEIQNVDEFRVNFDEILSIFGWKMMKERNEIWAKKNETLA